MTKIRDEAFWHGYYEASFTYDPRRKTVWKEVCRFLQRKYIAEDSVILDAGAGYCDFSNAIRGREKHAVDVMDTVGKYANPDVTAHVHSCADLAFFADDQFDVVFASNLLEHLRREDLLATLSEFRRVLKSGARLILLQPNFRYCYRTYFDDYTHLQIFTDRGLKELIESFGFRTIDLIPRFLPVNMKSTLKLTLPKLEWIVRIYLHLPWKPRAAQMLVVTEKQKPNNARK